PPCTSMENRVKACRSYTLKYCPVFLTSFTLTCSKSIGIFHQPSKLIECSSVGDAFNRSGDVFFLAFGKMEIQRCPGVFFLRRIYKRESVKLITQNGLR